MKRSKMMPHAHHVSVASKWSQQMGGEHGTRAAILHAEGVLVHDRDGRDLIRWTRENNIGAYSGVFVPFGKHAGQWCWSIPIDRGASALVGSAYIHGQSNNRVGVLRPQICLAGVVSNMDFAKMTKHARRRWYDGLRWLESWGIPATPVQADWSHGAKRISWDRYARTSGWSTHGLAPNQKGRRGLTAHTDGAGQDWHDLLAQPRC